MASSVIGFQSLHEMIQNHILMQNKLFRTLPEGAAQTDGQTYRLTDVPYESLHRRNGSRLVVVFYHWSGPARQTRGSVQT